MTRIGRIKRILYSTKQPNPCLFNPNGVRILRLLRDGLAKKENEAEKIRLIRVISVQIFLQKRCEHTVALKEREMEGDVGLSLSFYAGEIVKLLSDSTR